MSKRVFNLRRKLLGGCGGMKDGVRPDDSAKNTMMSARSGSWGAGSRKTIAESRIPAVESNVRCLNAAQKTQLLTRPLAPKNSMGKNPGRSWPSGRSCAAALIQHFQRPTPKKFLASGTRKRPNARDTIIIITLITSYSFPETQILPRIYYQ